MNETCSECPAPLPEVRSRSKLTCSRPCYRERGYRLAREQYTAAKAAAGGVPKKKCRLCREEKFLEPSSWPFSHGAPKANVCQPCDAARTKARRYPDYDKRRRQASPVTKLLKVEKLAQDAVDAARREPWYGDVSALEHGARTVNAMAKRTMREVAKHARDESSKYHADALKLLFERAMPQKVFDGLALDMMHAGEFGDVGRADPEQLTAERKPRRAGFTINIQLTRGPTEESDSDIYS